MTQADPGGDAAEPVDAALERLLTEPVGRHVDYWHTLEVAFPDRPHWKGTRFKRYPTRAAYQYGARYVGIAVLAYRPAAGEGSPSACMQPLLSEVQKAAEAYDIELGSMHREARPYRRGPEASPHGEMLVVRTSGRFNTLFRRDEYVAALVAYESWPGTCLVQGFAVRVGSDVMLARRVVTRWVEDAAPALHWASRLRSAPPFENR